MNENLNEKATSIVQNYLDRLLEKSKNPDTPLIDLNDSIRILGYLHKMGFIHIDSHFAMSVGSSEICPSSSSHSSQPVTCK